MRIYALVAAIMAAWPVAAAAQEAAPAREYIIRDNGIRCHRAPCASMTATAVAGGQSTAITRYDLSGLGLTEAGRDALGDDLYHGRIVVLGFLKVRGEERIVVVTRVLRRAPGAPAPRTRLP